MIEIWSPRAIRHLEEAWDFISSDSPASADLVVERVFSAVDLLKTQPQMGRVGRVDGTRELAVPRTSYLIVYRVLAGALELIAILHGSQQWPDSFED